MQTTARVSVIIVNFNVKDFVLHALQSIKRALTTVPHEILVVDNASVDGSVQLIEREFPDVRLIANEKNVGFSAANNQALREARGEFLVLINPDTVVQEDTFTSLIKFMEDHPDAGAATCKILNPDGSFSIDCRHSVPTPMTAFWKLIGLNRIFPKSKIFGRYNLTYLDIDKTYAVDAISGSFMFIRREAFEQVGYLDEDYFMYCEDVDYCYRIGNAGWKIYYVPESNIIHYKGESTKKDNLDYVITFNKSLYLFYTKHFQQKYVTPFRWLILVGVFIRGIIVYLRNFFARNIALIIDLLFLNAVILGSFYWRYEMRFGFSWHDFFNQYVVINGLASLIFMVSAVATDLHRKNRFSMVQAIKSNLMTFSVLASLTFFLNQFAFSRMVVLISAFASLLVMMGWRKFIRKTLRGQAGLFSRKTLLVGTEEQARAVLQKLRGNPQPGFDIVGVVALENEEVGRQLDGLPIVTSLGHLRDYARMERIDHVIFSTHNIPYETILKTMSRMDDLRIDFKIIPENLEVIIGKSSIEYLANYPLVDIDYAIAKPFNRLAKRALDLVASVLFLIPGIFLLLLQLPLRMKHLHLYKVWDGKGEQMNMLQDSRKPFHGVFNRLLILTSVFRGKLSLVGAPLREAGAEQPSFFYKPGLTGIWSTIRRETITPEELENYELYYLKNQNIWLDLEIIFKAMAGNRS